MANPKFISRSEAKARGLVRYFPGTICKHGHAAERLTVNGQCVECCRNTRRQQYWEKRDENLARQREWREKNAEKYKASKERSKLKQDPDLARRRKERDRVERIHAEALERGDKQYFTGVPCSRGHTENRYTKNKLCVECTREDNERGHKRRLDAEPEKKAPIERKKANAAERARRSELYRQVQENRREALESGGKTYYSPRPCPDGHIGERYTSSGGCVECAAQLMRSAERKQYDHRYYEENKEYIKQRSSEYNERTKEHRTKVSRDWVKKNPEKRRIISLSYKARRRSQERQGDSTADIREWESGQKKVCYWCGTKCPENYHIDHYTPLAKGGTHTVNNLVIACPPCNFTKSAKDPYEFAQEKGRLF